MLSNTGEPKINESSYDIRDQRSEINSLSQKSEQKKDLDCDTECDRGRQGSQRRG